MPFGGLLTLGVSAGTSLLGGLFGSNAASKAAKQQGAAANKAIGVQGNQLTNNIQDTWDAQSLANNTIREGVQGGQQLLSPYSDSGKYALSSLQDLSGANGPLTNKFSFNPSDLASDPGYAFTLQQGQDAIQRSAAAQGKLFSGGTLKSLAGYTTGTANQYFNDAFNRNLSTFNTNQAQAMNRIGTLQGLAGLGYSGSAASANLGAVGGAEQAANDLSSSKTRVGLGEDYANSVGGYLTNQGNAQAQGTQNSARSWLTALDSGTNATLQYLAGRPGGQTINSQGGLGTGPMPLPPPLPPADY